MIDLDESTSEIISGWVFSDVKTHKIQNNSGILVTYQHILEIQLDFGFNTHIGREMSTENGNGNIMSKEIASSESSIVSRCGNSDFIFFQIQEESVVHHGEVSSNSDRLVGFHLLISVNICSIM